MNAKKARPVDDPKALVPFGWAPGGYHCAACSICGEAHSGSDKRSMRCQDCAEALRDKRADEPATTLETADHAELAATKPDDILAVLRADRLPECSFDDGRTWELDGVGVAETFTRAADTIETLLSEIAALRGERDDSLDDRPNNKDT